MALNRKQLNRQQTIRDIESAFLSLYQEGGIDNVRISELCQRCFIARSTFYYYFEDKYAVLHSAEDRLLNELWAICGKLPDEIERGLVDQNALRTVAHLRTHIDWYRALLGEFGDPHFARRWQKDIEKSMCNRLARHNGNQQDIEIRSVMFASALIGLYTHIVTQCPDIPDHRICDYMDNLLTHLLMK